MADHNFKRGDVVTFLTIGIPMEVTYVFDYWFSPSEISVVYTDSDGDIRVSSRIHPDSLKLYKD